MRSGGYKGRMVSWARFSVALAFVFLTGALRVEAQTFSSGSDGSDGAYAPAGAPGTVIAFDPTQFSGSHVAANIFNFTTITIPVGVTVKLSGDKINGPVIWLAQGDVNIQGTITLDGGSGHLGTSNAFQRFPSIPGAGGFAGGVGGNTTQNATAGTGPGGGAVSTNGSGNGGGGAFTGNQFLVPLVGGSGGAGVRNGSSGGYFGPGGGAGGGAIMIASSTQITVGGAGGTISAAGGNGSYDGNYPGGGAGGAIRLVANTISSNGRLSVAAGGPNPGTNGIIRLEAYNIVGGSGAAPLPLFLPTVGPGTAKVISIGGNTINANQSTFPDITINTTSAVDVVIQTQNVPTSATVSLTILDENGVADAVIQAPPLGNCAAGNICTTTVPVVFPFGASRGLTRVTWVQ